MTIWVSLAYLVAAVLFAARAGTGGIGRPRFGSNAVNSPINGRKAQIR